MVELEYHYSAISNELIGLDFEDQQLLKAKKRVEKTDVVCLPMKGYNSTCNLAKGIKPESDQSSGPRCRK